MRKARWLAEWRNSENKPVFYHCISRVVDRRFVLGSEEKEKFRTLMRMQEKFTGCRVLSYCLMNNHFHILLEVPPMPEEGLSDGELLKRLEAIYGEAFVAGVAVELAEARQQVKEGLGEESVLVGRIHKRFSYRMQNLGEFMKGLLQRYTQWHNRTHSRTGRLWEDRFKSVIVEDGVAAKTMAAYIDLNPVRAGIVNPHFPALRSDPMALSGASRRKQIPCSRSRHSLTPLPSNHQTTKHTKFMGLFSGIMSPPTTKYHGNSRHHSSRCHR